MIDEQPKIEQEQEQVKLNINTDVIQSLSLHENEHSYLSVHMRRMGDEFCRALSSCSAVASCEEGENFIQKSHNVKKKFNLLQKEIELDEKAVFNVKNNFRKMKMKQQEDSLLKYIRLHSMVHSQNFDKNFGLNQDFTCFVLSHPFLPYLDQWFNIKTKFPNFANEIRQSKMKDNTQYSVHNATDTQMLLDGYPSENEDEDEDEDDDGEGDEDNQEGNNIDDAFSDDDEYYS